MAILVVAQDPALLDVLAFTLRRDGHDVLLAHDADAGLRLWRTKQPALVLLDVDLPDGRGWEVCTTIRAEALTPIMLLSASRKATDAIMGLNLGADDYLCMPFNPAELSARIRAVLRRTKDAPAAVPAGFEVLTAGELRLDPQFRAVSRNGESMVLTPIEFKLLYELVLNQGQVLSHQLLTDRIWGYDEAGGSSMLKGHIRNLRRKLEPTPSAPIYIQTVTGVGYSFQRAAAEARGGLRRAS